jgi:hypothetical protein
MRNDIDAALMRTALDLGRYVREREYAPVSVVAARRDLQIRECPTGRFFFYGAAKVLGLELLELRGRKVLVHEALRLAGARNG